MSKDKMALADLLKTLREKNGLSVRQLAHLIGKDPAQVSRWENGNVVPSIYTLQALAYALDYDFYELLKLI